ncbi:ribonuclease E inhibitor RraB [Janibacter limosus]|jgi:precorrin-6B methylase 1|uniref:ribonuclease E inhibitor RraB n=1 Tax=Janibacter limosus TaxID=53458 RepID=UPI000830EF5A|nr:ribonuclease E inhibitor RraB [Janibacter limosus]
MSEHLMVFPDRDDADRIADDLRDEGFTQVRVVREALAGEDDSDDHDWAVHVREAMVADESGAVAHGLRERFAALAEEHDGWYDPEPRP